MSITISELKKAYGKKVVLNNINMKLDPGKIIGVVGANGAGKTTLFNCITGMIGFEGKINYSQGNLKDVTGFLPASPYFLSRVTGYEYIRLFLQARNIDYRSDQVTNIFDLPLNEYAETYSTGMKKKLALTAILLQKNDIFILDEPFSGVDIQSNILIKEVLFKLRQLNKTIVLSSHIFSTLHEVCDELHYLKAGDLLKTADKSEFKSIEEDMIGKEFEHKIDQIQF